MTFSATVDADVLLDALAPISALVSECKIHTEANALEITAVDPANVGMGDIKLDAGAYAHYEGDGGTLGVNLDRLEEVLGMADSGDMVQFELNDETRKLEIVIGGLEYTLALIDPDSIRQEPDIPDLDLPATYVFEGSELDRAVTAADLVSDHISVAGKSEDELVISADGDTDDVVVTIGDDDLLSGRHEGDAPVRSLFSLDYLENMVGPIGKETDVSLLIGDEVPMTLRYSMHSGDVQVVNCLAPRIQSD